MATFEFRPGNVYSLDNSSVYPATVVGAQPAWSDDSDASYAEFGQFAAPRNSQARADFAADAFAAIAPSAVSVVIRAKVQRLNPDALLGLYLYDQALTAAFGNQNLAAPVDGWVETAVIPQDAATNPDVVALGDLPATLAGPTFALVNNVGAAGGTSLIDFRVLELVVVVTTATLVPVGDTWLRVVQRSDGLDLGGPPRAVQHTGLRSGITAN